MLPSQPCSRTLQPARWLIFCQLFTLTILKNPMQMATMGFAFVTNSGSGTVYAFAVDTSGSLSLVAGAPFPAGAGAEFLAFDTMHKFLFVSNQGANSVSAFSVNTGTGTLTAVAGSPFATGARPTGIAVDPMRRFVFVANQRRTVFPSSVLEQTARSPPLPDRPLLPVIPLDWP